MNIIDGIKFVVAVTGLTAAYYMGSHQDSLPSRFVAALWSITRHWTRYCKVSRGFAYKHVSNQYMLLFSQ
jgi:hypothetical protein